MSEDKALIAKDLKCQLEQVEGQLRLSEERYRTLFEHATDVILSCALTGEVLSVNQEAERLLGWPREFIIGKHYRQFLDAASVLIVEEQIRSTLLGSR